MAFKSTQKKSNFSKVLLERFLNKYAESKFLRVRVRNLSTNTITFLSIRSIGLGIGTVTRLC